ncbi:hypothetical protein C6503_20420 [Candidatus Poribacteria bacterium]|nr:MAG: hypothetical protein C6503_20420 [Candidatus Poribacteria bacterium]
MRRFGTQGRVYPGRHYIVSRTEEIADIITRIEEGRSIVLFAPRQTGKTTFFRFALDALTATSSTYFPIQLNFEAYKNLSPSDFYDAFYKRVRKEIEQVFQERGHMPADALTRFLDSTKLTNHISMMEFFEEFAGFLDAQYGEQKVVLIIDEFDGIPQGVLSDFLHTLRAIYLSDEERCPHSVGIVGVKSIEQLNYDRSVSPFNIQDEFHLRNFTLQQVQELLMQYTDEIGQPFASEVIEVLHRQTAGQPFLVNRLAQIFTEELEIPKTETITMTHFARGHAQLLEENNANLMHLITNINRDPRFESVLMRIVSYERGVQFSLRSEIITELATYGVIAKGADGMCEIVNPIYQHCIIQAFQPLINGLEGEYFSQEAGVDFIDYLTSAGTLEMEALLDNFKDFIARVGYRILQVPDTPQEFVGQYLLYTYLDQFVRVVGGGMYLEVQTGRGRIDLLIQHNRRKYIVETKIWEGERRYQSGKAQLAAYLKLEDAAEGYYVVFDHRADPEPRTETETFDDFTIRSYVVPVMQEKPSSL